MRLSCIQRLVVVSTLCAPISACDADVERYTDAADVARSCWGLAATDTGCGVALGNRAATMGMSPFTRGALLHPDDCGGPVDCQESGSVAAVVVSEATPEIPEQPDMDVDLADRPVPLVGGERVGDEIVNDDEEPPPDAGEATEMLLDSTSVQMEAIRMYNEGEDGWEQAVEAALSMPELRNAPNLAFAGLGPAYRDQHYDEVLRRASVVWDNLDKGYLQQAEQRTAVTEYACRAGYQLHMQGQEAEEGERWCRLWVDRLDRGRQDATLAGEMLEQMQ